MQHTNQLCIFCMMYAEHSTGQRTGSSAVWEENNSGSEQLLPKPGDLPVLKLDRFPKVDLCHQPTALEAMPRLSEHLGGPKLWIKRDDCTGLASGGNKTRKLEFLVGEALEQGADLLVTQGAIQSNHVRQTAAAACKFGLQCHALLEHRVPNTGDKYNHSGNVFLDRIFGATFEYREAGLDMNAETLAVVETLKQSGRKPYFIPGGGSNDVGALGYASCGQELHLQAKEIDVAFDWLVMGTGSTGTQAGLVAGLNAVDSDMKVMGVSVRQPHDKQVNAVNGLAQKVAARLGPKELPIEKIIVDDNYVGEGYGIPAESTLEAIMMAARFEGLLLDPVYSGKGFAGLIGMVRAGFFTANDNVVFLHTGGSVALFAYEDVLSKHVDSL